MIDKTLRFCHGRTLWQKRFAEICREVIVPELKRMIEGGAENDKNRTE